MFYGFYGLLTFIYVLACFLLVLIVLVQKGKSSMGIGGMGGGAQMLFGGSGGQDFLQKFTWVLGAIFMFGSLSLAIMKTSHFQTSRYLQHYKGVSQIPANTTTQEQQEASVPVAQEKQPSQAS